MCTKSLRKRAHVGICVCSGLLLVCSALSFTATWWSVNFWDCGGSYEDTTHYSLLLSKGLCSDSSSAEKTNFDDCHSWADIGDDADDDDAEQDAALYIHGRAVSIAAMAVSSVLFCVSAASILNTPQLQLFRAIKLICFCVLFLLYMFCIGLLSETWYTEPSHYPTYEFCESWYSGPDIGLSAAVFSTCLCTACALFMLFPCYSCVDEDNRASAAEEDSLTTPLVIPVATAVPSAPPLPVADATRV